MRKFWENGSINDTEGHCRTRAVSKRKFRTGLTGVSITKMRKKLSILIILLIGFSMFAMFAHRMVEAQEIIWNTNPTPLPTPMRGHASVVWNGKIYVIGGNALNGHNPLSTVYFGNAQPDGTIDSWLSTTPLPEARSDARAVVWNNFVYVLGGNAPRPPYKIERDTVWYAPINSDGTLGNWTTTTPLPDPVTGHVAVVWNGRIYVAGGWTGFRWKNEVYYAEIHTNGSLGAWNPTTPLPSVRRDSATLVRNGIIYVIGGSYPTNKHANTVYYAVISSAGPIEAWSTTTALPISAHGLATVVLSDNIYVIGGENKWTTILYDTVFRGTPNLDGTIESWTKLQKLPEPVSFHTSVVVEGRIYVMGGHDGFWQENPKDTIYYSSTPPVPATVDIDPDTLNLKSNGEWITAYIELPEGYNVNDIDVNSIMLNATFSVDEEAPIAVGDYDSDNVSDLMVKFDRATIIQWLGTIDYGEDTGKHYEVSLTVTGTVGGTQFTGTDLIKVLE